MKKTVNGTRSAKAQDTLYRKKYGIGISQYKTLLEQQNGQCFLCGTDHWRNLAVDHNHTTGKVRRLLCSKCNMAIGLLNDDPGLIKKCLEYIETDFDLPPDVDVCPRSQDDKRRWRRVVFSPKGIFSSMEIASQHYDVDLSTMGSWCGAYTYYTSKQAEGFSHQKVFLSLNEVKQQYNIVE